MAGPLATSLRGLWVSGLLPPYNGGPSQGRRPDNRPGGDDSDPGLASRRESSLTAKNKKGTPVTAWAASTHCEGKGPENPNVVAPLAEAGCRGNRRYYMFGHSQHALLSRCRHVLRLPCTTHERCWEASSAHLEIASCALRRCDHAATGPSCSLGGVQTLLETIWHCSYATVTGISLMQTVPKTVDVPQ